MADEDAGLVCGLEIHQQLSGKKLFCSCPAEIIEREPDLVVHRQLRASAGETGDVDIAAAAEHAKRKRFSYHAYNDATCLVEIDEEPPHPVNPEAARTAAMVAKALQSSLLPTVQFMRKTIVDGSNVAGFQRTGLVALGGIVPGQNVRIQSIALEEDAAKIVSRTPEEDTYNLSRLGIPLLEIATEPDITSPEQAKEVAATLGMILRSTRRVKRGLGTIRQDLNVSVPEGTRIEIKGAQDLRLVPTFIRNEAMRQRTLAKLATELPKIIISDLIDATEQFERSQKPFIAKALKQGHKALGVSVDGCSGLFGKELCQGYRVGSELADLARSAGLGGIIHGDEDFAKYGLEKQAIAERLLAEKEDAFIVCIGPEETVRDVFAERIIPRIRQLALGVPEEVRRANPDGTTSFLRPISTGARMYPETDVPLVTLPLDVEAPLLLSEETRMLAEKTGLSEDLAKEIVANDLPIIEFYEKYPSLDYKFLSSALLEWPREIGTRLKTTLQNPLPLVTPLLKEVHEGRLEGSAIKSVLEEIAKEGGTSTPERALELASRYAQMTDEELLRIVRETVEANPGVRTKALMGEVMQRARGRASGKRVMRFLEEAVGE